MSLKTKTIFLKTLLLVALALGSTAAFADDIVPGTITPCKQLPLVNDPNNPNESANGSIVGTDGTYDPAGVCVDVPVNLMQVKVVFNLDNVVTTSAGDSVGLRHMWMLGTALQMRMKAGLVNPDNVSIVGLMHGSSMAAGWAFKNSPQEKWIQALFKLANDPDYPVHIQLEACGVTIKGMQQKGAKLNGGMPLDEKAVYPGIKVNQGAIGRLIDLEQHGYVYVQED